MALRAACARSERDHDDATSTIYSAFLVEEECTASSFAALLDLFTAQGLPASLYTDRGSRYFFTPKAGEAVDKERPTQVGRALKQLGIARIPASSPQARGRSERMFGTAGAVAEGTQAGRHFHGCGGQSLHSARFICRRTLPALPSPGHRRRAPSWRRAPAPCARCCACRRNASWRATTP
jgi:hypothetical protein